MHGRRKQMKAESLAENCNHVGRQCKGRMGRWMTALPLTWELFQLTQKLEYLFTAKVLHSGSQGALLRDCW